MDYLIFNSDGSIKEQQLTKYIQQGSSLAYSVFVSYPNAEGTDITTLVCNLANGDKSILLGTFVSNYPYEADDPEDPGDYDGEYADGWVFSLTEEQTRYFGPMVAVVQAIKGTVILVNFPFTLLINETGVYAEAETNITISDLNNFLKMMREYYNIQNGSGENSLQQKGTIAGYKSQTALGAYNDNKPTTLFEVGNGTDDEHRNNAFEVYADGHAEVGAQGNTDKSVAALGQVKVKLDKKTTTGIFAYTHNGDQQGEVAIINAAVPGTIPIRGNSGNITVEATPVNPTHAASKKYVDDSIAGMAASINAENGTGTNAVRQKMADATVNFAGRNPNAEALDPTISTVIDTGASGNQSAAFGKNTMSLATASFTNGNKTLAKGEESHAEGYQSVTLGDGSHAEGARTTAVGLQSHSEGADTIANGEASHAEGHSTTADNYYAHSEGEDTIASGHASHAEGEASKATALSSHAEGSNNYIGVKPQDGPGGGGETTPSQPSGYVFTAGESSHAEGFDNFVYGAGSHAEGAQNVINGTMSHAEGVKNTIGNTDGAHAEGYQTTVIGTYAHAEGQLTHAEGYASHAEGTSTRAHGTCSHAEGSTTTAYADFSHTMGTGTYAGNESMLAIGKYNNNKSGTLFEVGNGTADNNRSNAFEIYEDGHAEIGSMGSTPNSAANKQYVDTAVSSAVGMRLFEHKIQCEVYDVQNTRFVFNLTVINTSAAAIAGNHYLTELYYGMGIKQTILSQYDAVLYVLADTGQGVDEMKIAELEENGTYSFHTGAIGYQAQFTVIGTDTITQL